VLAAVSHNGYALMYATAAAWGDAAVVLAAVTQDGYALRCASAALQDDREVVLAAAAQDGFALHYASAALQLDGDVVRALTLGNQERRAYQLARRHGFRASVALKMVLGGWAPCRHFMFRPTIHETVHAVHLVAQRLDAVADASLGGHDDDDKHQMLCLPYELWCCILRFETHAGA
jgi:hypothetical protein